MACRSPVEPVLRTVPFLVALSTVWAPASAQVVQGRLLDQATDQPVASVTVQLLRGDEGDDAVATGVTDDEGHFVLPAPTFATYRLRTTRIGYQPVTTRPFELVEGADQLEVEVRISAVAVPLAPLTIVSERAARPNLRLENAGYYERREMYGLEGLGLGQFLEQEEIRRYNPTRVSDALRMVRGVLVEGAGGRRQVITLRGHGSLKSTSGRCIPQVYVDGAPAATGRNIDELLSPWSIAAVEVYVGLSVPPEFWRDVREVDSGGDLPWMDPRVRGNLGGVQYLPSCGAIVLWTGGGLPDSPNPEPAAIGPDQALVAKSALLALHLTIATDSVTLGDSLRVVLTVNNLSDDTRSLCIMDSRYTLRGPNTSRDIVENVDQGSCVRDVALAPRASHSWQDVVTFLAGQDQPGDVLIQKRFRLRYLPCGAGHSCEVQLRSEPHWFTLHRDDGGW